MRSVLHVKRLSALFVLAVFVASFFVTIASPIVAAKSYTQMNPTEQAKSWVYLKIFEQCWTKGQISISEDDIKSGNWFYSTTNSSSVQIKAPAWFVRSLGESGGSSYVTNDSGLGSSLNETRVFFCSRDSKSSWLKPLAELWGFTDNTSVGGSGLISMFCELGGRRANNKNSNLTDCQRGTKNFDRDNITKNPIAVILKKIGNAGSSLTPAAEYVYWRGIFQKGCGASATDVNYDNGDSKNLFIKNVKTVADNGTVSSRNYLMSPVSGGPGNKTDKTRVYDSTGSEADMSCESIAKAMSNKADAFSEWVKDSTCEKKYPNNEVALEACKQGRSADTTEDCDALFSNDKTKRDACVAGMGLSDGTAASSSESENDDGAASEDKATCSADVGALGWILCPTVNFMGKMTDGLFNIIDGFLSIDNDVLFEEDNKASDVWSTFRAMANVLLIIASIVMIYSYLTGVGISNYGIKRLLPKLIMVAILINFSLFVCRLLIDISNVFGGSIYGLLNSAQAGDGKLDVNILNITGSILAGGLGVAAVGGVSLVASSAGVWVLVLILIGALLALAITFLILLARNAGVIILSVLAPLAFVMLLLPSTEKFYKKWWQMFVGLLLVYPMIAAVFGLSKIAASIFSNSASIVDQLLAVGISCIPMLISTSLLQASMAATGLIGAKLQGAGRKGVSAVFGSTRRAFGETDVSKALAIRKQDNARRRAMQFGASSGIRGKALDFISGNPARRVQYGSKLTADQRDEEKDQAKALLNNETLYNFNRIADGVKSGVITDRGGNSRRLTDLEYVAATELMIEKGNPEQRRTAFAQAMARSQKMEDSDKVYLQRQATNSMFSKGETAVFGASAIGNLDGVGPVASLDVEGQQYTFDMTTEQGITNYLGVAAAGRIKAKETKPAVMLGDSKTAAVMQKVLSGDFQDINGASVKFSDKEKDAIRNQLEAFATTEDGSGEIAEASLNILGVRSAAKQQADAAAEHKKQQQDFIDALRNRKN